MLNPSDFKRALQAIDSLGSTPAILARVLAVAKRPDTDLGVICGLMRNDGPLTADILRIANSPYYSPATLHGNLASAVHYIGLRDVIRLVNLSLARQMFARDLSSYGVSAMDYWSASVAAGLLMEALAGHSALNREDAYTIGILHVIGRVLINRVIEEQGFSVFWDGLQPIELWERSSVGFDHAEAGAMLLERWHFPDSTCEIIRGQLRTEPVDGGVSMAGALQFARRLLSWTGPGFVNEAGSLPETDPFVVASGLNPESVGKLISSCRADFESIRQSVDLG